MHALPRSAAFKPAVLHRAGRCSAGSRLTFRPKCAAGSASRVPTVVVTREHGKNDKLIKALSKHPVRCLEMPLIEHADGPDRAKLPELIKQGGYDWIAITSPEAANVFVEGWKAAGSPKVRIAVVGGGTGEALQAADITADYTATKALGKVLGAELPKVPGGSNVVLYPSSVKAGKELQQSLVASGFAVNRVHTYDTVGVKSVEPSTLEAACAADIVAFGSPSAVKAWVALVGLEAAQKVMAVCIGSTSARACEAAGLTRFSYAESPGIEGWAECILDALKEPQLV